MWRQVIENSKATSGCNYKTFSWEQVKTKDPLDVDRIKSAVSAALAAKGWTQVDSGGDVSIVAMEITREHQILNTFYDGFGGGWGWRRCWHQHCSSRPLYAQFNSDSPKAAW